MAGVSLVCGRQVDSRVVTRWLGCVFSPALYLELRRVISSLMVWICRSFRITAFGTYHDASVKRRRDFSNRTLLKLYIILVFPPYT
jgi:hypothetical protein